MLFIHSAVTGQILLFKVRKHEKTIDVKTAIGSVLALSVVEKMLRSSVKDRPLASFSPERPVCTSQILKRNQG